MIKNLIFQCAELDFLLIQGRNTNISQKLVLNINNSDGKKFQESLEEKETDILGLGR